MKNSLKNIDFSYKVYKSFFENNPDATYAMLPNGEFILFNDAASELTGYTQEEAIGIHYSKVIDPKYLKITEKHFDAALAGKNERFESVLITKSGEKCRVSILIVPIMENEMIKGIIGVTKDITEQTRMKILKDGQNKILQMITKNKPFQVVLDEITSLFEIVSSYDGKCSIMIVDEGGESISIASSQSLPKKYVQILNSLSIGKNTGSCGTAAFEKRTVIVEDTQTDPHWAQFKDIALEHNLHACWSIPLLDDNNEILGTFAIYYDHNRAPSHKDLIILEEASYITSLAIQHYKSKKKIHELAYHDSLTGLPNRRFLEGIMGKVLKNALQTRTNFSILFIDLDGFKSINDTYGHNIGDLFLIEVANRLKQCLPKNSTISRQGGDEFIILLENASNEQAEQVADEIVSELEHSFMIEGIEIFVTPSIGISVYPKHGKNASELLKKADAAMYHAKKEGGNNYQFHDDILEKQNKEKIEIEKHLRRALVLNEFTLYYQPKMHIPTGNVTGVEALIRWTNPVLGVVPPDRFIPIAEDTGLIIPIGEWVMKTACEQLKKWENEGLTDLTMAVNLSIRQFFNPNLITSIKAIIHETKINPELLDIEITESMTMDVEVATDILNQLKEIGLKISIDDFGTGYSSYNYLKHFPIDFIKIDKSFINDISTSDQSMNIVRAFFLTADALGFKIVAEGVETKEQLELLNQLHCEEIQGYYFSKPLPSHELKNFLRKEFQNKNTEDKK